MSVALTLEELADITAEIGKALLPAPPAGVVVTVASIVLRGASGVVRVIEAKELEQLRQARATGLAAGRAAYEASKLAGRKP